MLALSHLGEAFGAPLRGGTQHHTQSPLSWLARRVEWAKVERAKPLGPGFARAGERGDFLHGLTFATASFASGSGSVACACASTTRQGEAQRGDKHASVAEHRVWRRESRI